MNPPFFHRNDASYRDRLVGRHGLGPGRLLRHRSYSGSRSVRPKMEATLARPWPRHGRTPVSGPLSNKGER